MSTMQQINAVANARQRLYFGGPMDDEARRKLGEYDAELAVLWDRHRREVAGKTWGADQPEPQRELILRRNVA